MAIQHCEHDMNEDYITGVGEVVARDYVPTAMPIMTFATLSDIECQLYFQSDTASSCTGFIDKVGVPLIVIVLVRRAQIHAVRKNVADKARKVVALNQSLQRRSDLFDHVPVHGVNHRLCRIQRVTEVIDSQPYRQRHLRPEKSIFKNRGRYARRFIVCYCNKVLDRESERIRQPFQHLDGKIFFSSLDTGQILI